MYIDAWYTAMEDVNIVHTHVNGPFSLGFYIL